MKSIIPFTFALFLFGSSWAQLCTSKIEFGEIESETQSSQISVLEIDPFGAAWFNLSTPYGGRGFGMVSENDTLMFYTGTDLMTHLHPTVNTIAFDNKDSVWIGTQSGLAQFDGLSETGWKIFKKSNSDIPSDDITAILIDDNNVKWIGCGSYGTLVSFYDGVWTTVGDFNGRINDIEMDNEGGIWVAKQGAPGLSRYYDGIWTDFSDFVNIPNITVDKYNRILVPSGDTLVILLNQNIVNVFKVVSGTELGLDDIAVGPDNFIWLSSNAGLFLQSDIDFYRYNQNNSPIPDLVLPVPLDFDPYGNLWFSYSYLQGGKSYPGIGKLFQSSEEVIPISVINNSLFEGSTQDPVSNWPVVYICDGDSVELEATENANSYVWEEGASTERSFFAYSSDTISLTYKGTDGCYYYDTVKSVSQHVFEEEEICLVTVDPVTSFNMIIWERTPDKGTSKYLIYRETSTIDVYDTIGSIQFVMPGSFIDSLSDPTMQSYKYKISVIDNCGNESVLSYPHATMHLTLSQDLDGGTNLIWSKYEGFEVQTYNIWRGSDTSEMAIIGSVSGSNFTYTDHNPLAGTNFYKIEVVSPNSCNPDNLKTTYNSSFSNIVDILLEGQEDYYTSKLNIFPNPAKSEITITLQNPGNESNQIILLDTYGRIHYQKKIFIVDQFILDCSSLTSGLYYIELRGSKIYRGRIIVE